jgi:hypothetical protein
MTNNNNYKILYPRGSEWRKWDLHIHSDSCPGSPEQIINRLIEKEISVFSITDHSSVENIDEFLNIVIEKQKEGKNIYFLPGIELKTDKGKRPVHLIGIFPLKDEEGIKINSNYLEQNLLSKINCSDSDIIKAGKNTLGEGKSLEVYKKRGLLEITVNFENASEKIKELGGITIVHAGTKTSGIETEMHHPHSNNVVELYNSLGHTKRKLMKNYIDICELPNWNKSNLIERDFYLETFNKPSIVSSDSHKLSNIGEKYTWIKADPTFEGLKQIIYEPEERVYIGKSPPKGKNDAKVIDRIEIRNSNNWFEDKPILLNDNLVSIIGEKGAGKTALTDFIALAGGDFDIKEEDPGSFILKALKSSKQIEKTIENCKTTIYWRDGSSDSITITKDFKDYRDLKKVRYLSQNFIEKKCRPEQAGELQKEVENIIFQYIPIQDRMGQTTFVDLKERRTHSIQLRKSRCQEDIKALNIEIFKLEEEICSLDTRKEEKDNLQTEIRQLEIQKPKPTTEEEKSIEEKLSLLNSRKSQLNEKIAIYKTQLSTIETIRTKVEALKTYVDKQLTDIKNDLESVDLGNIYEKLKFSISPDFNDDLDSKKSEIKTQIQELQGTEDSKEQISEDKLRESIESDLNILTNDYISKLPLGKINDLIYMLESKSSLAEDKRNTIKVFEEKIEKNKKRISELKKIIKDIEELKKPLLPKKIKEREETYKNYFILLQEEKRILEELYAPLRDKLDKENLKEEKQIEFFARIELDIENFCNKAESIIDFSRTGRYYRKRDLLFKEIKTISEKIELGETSDVYNLIAQLYKTFEEDKDRPIDIKEQLLGRKKKIDFYNWIFDVSDFSVTYSIKFQGTNIELLSPGKKGIVILLMYLVLDTESSIPLIIDQPEENLDNKSVYPYLINYFKKAKKRRQIIVITHNPNLVLNTDAEQIIVANFEAIPTTQKGRIKYISGAIENSFVSEKAKVPIEKQGIKEHGIDILEGGPEAFGKRKDRYEI